MIELTLAILIAAAMLTLISNISFVVNVGLILMTVICILTNNKKGNYMTTLELMLCYIFLFGLCYRFIHGPEMDIDYIVTMISVVLLFIIYRSIK